jgi:hypothetical protein
MAYGTVNADVIGTSVAGSNLGAGDASLLKNRLINGSMVIDQRNAGASVSTSSGGSAYTLDRWQFQWSQTSKFTIQQNAGSVTPPVGFSNYLGITSSSAYSVGASDYFFFQQKIEGFNFADLGWGTANAKTVTLSFWVYSSLTGTFGGSLQNSAENRAYPFSYSIPVASTWTQISVTIAGDTTGTWVGATNGTGVKVDFGFGVGSAGSASAGSWQAGAYYSATGATSVVGTSGATFYITGVQLEVGSSATGFEYRQYGQELALCQRYFEKSYDMANVAGYTGSNGFAGCAGVQGATTGSEIDAPFYPYKVSKRTQPTITFYDLSGNSGKVRRWNPGVATYDNNTASLQSSGEQGFMVFSASGNTAAGIVYQFYATAEL